MSEILKQIHSPRDLRSLATGELQLLCEEIRGEILKTVSANGGHFSPNLGSVELTVALERVFSGEDDVILWDVGHQAYAHKLLTGRMNEFRTLRKFGGLSGFLSPAESSGDKFYTGHAGVSISEAIGLAKANRIAGKHDAVVVAVIGDGSLGCGIALEALNYIRESNENFILVINDNKMAISRSVGAVAGHLNRLITSRRYNRLKTSMNLRLRRFPFGRKLIQLSRKVERVVKSFIVSGIVFEEFGMKYVGPINGHNLPELIDKFERVREINGRPVAVHVVTEKGRGCKFAEEHPETFHGCPPFDPATGKPLSPRQTCSFSGAFASSLVKLAEQHDDIFSITAAMASGTKLCEFQKRFPERFSDVGIAEEHALVFASGLAAGGLRPVIAIYATFLQRALDCVFHDVCLQKLPVIFGVDRAGAVEDGPTHHGIYDLPFLLSMPNLQIYLPADSIELEEMLFRAYREKCPVMLRYPRGSAEPLGIPQPEFIPGKSSELVAGKDVAIWCSGRESLTGLETAKLLSKQGISASVVNVRSLKPFDSEKLALDAKNKFIATVEDSMNTGGLASVVDSLLVNLPHRQVFHFGWSSNSFTPHGSLSDLRKSAGLTPEQIAAEIASSMNSL